MDRLKNHVTLITGAGSGMGQVVAAMFAKEGAQVIALDTQEAGLQ